MGTVFSTPNVVEAFETNLPSASGGLVADALNTGQGRCASLQGRFWECTFGTMFAKEKDPGILTPDALPDGSAAGMWAYLKQNNRLFGGAVLGLVLLLGVVIVITGVSFTQTIKDKACVTKGTEAFAG